MRPAVVARAVGTVCDKSKYVEREWGFSLEGRVSLRLIWKRMKDDGEWRRDTYAP